MADTCPICGTSGKIERKTTQYFVPNRTAEIRLKAIQAVVASQAEDDDLWIMAKTATERYLQQELVRLHRIIEEGDR